MRKYLAAVIDESAVWLLVLSAFCCLAWVCYASGERNGYLRGVESCRPPKLTEDREVRK